LILPSLILKAWETYLYRFLTLSWLLVCVSAVIGVMVLNDERNKTLHAFLSSLTHRKSLILFPWILSSMYLRQCFIFRFYFFFPEAGDVSHYLLRIMAGMCVFSEFLTSTIQKDGGVS